MRMSGARTRVVLWVLIFVASLSTVLPAVNVSAAQIVNRSLTLEANATAVSNDKPTASAHSITGHAGADQYVGLANHHFEFDIVTTAGIRSIEFEYCTTASGTCTTPTDMLSSGTDTALGTTANLGGSPTLTKTTNGAPYVAFTSDPTQAADIEVTLNGVYNPSAINTTFFVRITTYTSNNATTGATDTGTVAASTTRPIILSGTMPEYLRFCTAATIGVDGNGAADCTTATDGNVTFDQLFNPDTTATATSQMAASSNAGSGYVISYYGATLESGANSIPAMPTGASTTSIGQFGLNLKDNTTPDVGLEVDNAGISGQVYNGVAIAPYATADQFTFVASTATAVANSASTVSDLQLYTVSYIVNVPGSQAAGTYTTTLTYVCTPTF